MKNLAIPLMIAAACALASGCGGAPAADPAATGTQSSALTQRLGLGVLPSLHRIPKDKSPHDVIDSSITLAHGELIAFHQHPGPVFVVIATGTLTEDDGCGNIESHPAGTAFQEVPGHVHMVI